MNGEKNLKDHVVNLINALTNLSPSRNIISQFILLTPEDQMTLSHSFPEINIPEFKEVLKVMGILFGDKVECVKDSFAEALTWVIHKTFDWLDNEYIYFSYENFGQYGTLELRKKMDDVRSSLAKLAGLHVNLLPNPYLEWAELVIRKLSSIYGRDKVTRFLNELLNQLPLKDRDYKGKSLWDLNNKIRGEIGATPSEAKEIYELIVCLEGKSERIWSKGTSRHPEGDVWIEHSKYHLDPLLCESSRYNIYSAWGMDYVYEIRHKESLKRILEVEA